MSKKPHIEWACQHCNAANSSAHNPDMQTFLCGYCGKDWDAQPNEGHIVDGRVERCRFCGSSKLYVQKAFNRAWGVGIVAIGAITAILLSIYVHPFLFALVLVSFILVDMVLFRILPLIDVCYRCQSVYHGFDSVPDREGFDLELAEWNERQFTLESEHRVAGRAIPAPEENS